MTKQQWVVASYGRNCSNPAGGGTGEREMALVTSAGGMFECFWRLDETELRRQFEGADVAYFEAEGEGSEITIVTRVPDQG
jgi:hypothetical protein